MKRSRSKMSSQGPLKIISKQKINLSRSNTADGEFRNKKSYSIIDEIIKK